MSDGPIVRPHQKPVFALKKGEVSEPIDGPNGYYIYKVEDERTDPVSNLREVKVREILVAAKLDEAEYTAAKDKANAVQAKAKETGDLRAATTEAGLEVQTSGPFSVETLNIENVPDADARFLRSRLAAVALNEIPESFEAQRNIYVTKVIEVVPAVPQPLESVREKVLENTIARLGSTPEYRQQTAELTQKISASAKSLQDIVTQYPELGATIETLPAFSTKTYDFSKGPMWNPRDVMALAMDKEPGAFIGPINDFTGKTYFVEIVSKTPPDEKMLAEDWPLEQKTLREQALQQEEARRIEDYLAYLREDLMNKGLYDVDNGAFVRALGLVDEEGNPTGDETTADITGAPLTTPPIDMVVTPEAVGTDAAAPATAEGEAATAPAETTAPIEPAPIDDSAASATVTPDPAEPSPAATETVPSEAPAVEEAPVQQ